MRKTWKYALVLALIACLWWFNHYHLHLTPEDLRSRMLQFGAWAPVVYIAVYTIRPLIFFPATVLCLAGGLAFGPYWGTVYTMIGFMGDAVLAYGLGRYFGHRFVRRTDSRIRQWSDRLVRRTFPTIATLRLIPIIPFDIVSYAAGMAKVRFLPYAVGTLIGTLPVTVAYSFLGSSFTEDWRSLLWGLLLALLFIGGPILFMRWRRLR